MCKFWNIFLLFLLFTSGGLVPLADSFVSSRLFPPICYISLLYFYYAVHMIILCDSYVILMLLLCYS